MSFKVNLCVALLACLSVTAGQQFTLSQVQKKSQTLAEWHRVYTFEDSVIEMNTDYVMFSNRKTGRVRFRWSFFHPKTVSGEAQSEKAQNEGPQIKYQTRWEEIECDCRNKRFRFHDVRLNDAEGRLIRVEVADPPDEWRKVRFGSMMEKLFTHACQLIELRKKDPPLERSPERKS